MATGSSRDSRWSLVFEKIAQIEDFANVMSGRGNDKCLGGIDSHRHGRQMMGHRNSTHGLWGPGEISRSTRSIFGEISRSTRSTPNTMNTKDRRGLVLICLHLMFKVA